MFRNDGPRASDSDTDDKENNGRKQANAKQQQSARLPKSNQREEQFETGSSIDDDSDYVGKEGNGRKQPNVKQNQSVGLSKPNEREEQFETRSSIDDDSDYVGNKSSGEETYDSDYSETENVANFSLGQHRLNVSVSVLNVSIKPQTIFYVYQYRTRYVLDF